MRWRAENHERSVRLLDGWESNLEFGDQVGIVLLMNDLGLLTPWQKLLVAIYVRHDTIHIMYLVPGEITQGRNNKLGMTSTFSA